MRLLCVFFALIALGYLAAPIAAADCPCKIAPPRTLVTEDSRNCQCPCGPNCACTDGRCPDCKIAAPKRIMPRADDCAGCCNAPTAKPAARWVWVPTAPAVIVDFGLFLRSGRRHCR